MRAAGSIPRLLHATQAPGERGGRPDAAPGVMGVPSGFHATGATA